MTGAEVQWLECDSFEAGEARVDGRDWRADAGCGRADPELFFPARGTPSQDAVRICCGCRVRAECLAWALDREEPTGIWGGLSEGERARLLEQRRRVAVKRWICRNDWDAARYVG